MKEKQTGKVERVFRMPTGKHKGKPIHLLPSDYLKWVAENWDDGDISSEADVEYQFRLKHNMVGKTKEED